MGKWTEDDFEKKWTPVVGAPPWDNLHVHGYNHNILRYSSLKLLGHSKSKFIESIYRKGGTNVFINNAGHMTKKATVPIYTCEIPSKINS